MTPSAPPTRPGNRPAPADGGSPVRPPGRTPTTGPAEGASPFDRAVALFLSRTRHTRSGSAHTERAYRTDLRHFAAFLAERGHAERHPPETDAPEDAPLPFDAVTRRDAEVYLAGLAAEHAARTVRRRVSCVRSFYRFLRGLELVAHNPFDALDLPDVDRKSETHKVLSDDELARAARLLAADVAAADRRLATSEPGPDRARAFAALFTATRRRVAFTLMAFAGLRRAEVVGLTREAIVERPDGFALAFRGKGGKVRAVPLVGFAYRPMFDWLAVRRRVPTTAPTVLVTLNGRPVAPKQLKRDCRALGLRVEARHPLTPHVLRRTFATRALQASGDIRSVQVLLGHSSIATTEVYTHVDLDGLRTLVEATALPDADPAP
ncbi:tyrosine-type recombinase/integrase [Rubrivirga marina]|uniref:Integrase n=1 Tax=Rubrivirga marina TaxID=1196024 RepID=A0A271ISJ9_9BACT|nr:tyrosine-type recombinase/integrase [Rubrivirga marina]PAP74216.1 hypothetical protein BSZ37_21380 [Rubrivirga marina]